MKALSPLLLAACLVAPAACTNRLTKRHAGPRSAAKLVLKEEKGSRTSLALTALVIEEDAEAKPAEPSASSVSAELLELPEPPEPSTVLLAEPSAASTPGPAATEPEERTRPAAAPSSHAPVSQADASRFERRLVAGLLHRPFSGGLRVGAIYHPADRVVWSEVELWIPGDQPFTISGYDKVDTGYETVDLGRLTRTMDLGVSGGADLSAALGETRTRTNETATSSRDISRGLGGNASASATASESLQEEVQLRQRYVTLAASVEDGGKALRLVREGVYGIDLTGAVTVDASFRALDMRTTQLFALTETKLPDGRDGIAITRTLEVLPRVTTLRVCGFATSVIRNVERRLHTIRESDDRVGFQHSKTKVAWLDIELPHHFAFAVSIVHRATTAAGREVRSETLWLRSAAVAPQQATFASEADAQRIAGWISANAADLGEFATWSGGFELLGEGGVPLPSLGEGAMVVVEDLALDGEPATLPSCGRRPATP